MKKILALTFATLGALAIGGCASESHQSAEEPDSGQMIQLTKMQVIQMPNGFRNVAFGCIPGTTTQVFVTSRGQIEGGGSGTLTPSSITALDDAAYCGGKKTVG